MLGLDSVSVVKQEHENSNLVLHQFSAAFRMLVPVLPGPFLIIHSFFQSGDVNYFSTSSDRQQKKDGPNKKSPKEEEGILDTFLLFCLEQDLFHCFLMLHNS